MPALPIIDLENKNAAQHIAEACQNSGFFYILNHGVSEDLQNKLEKHSQAFFKLPLVEKMKIHMSLGGKAWRGFFPVGEELTSGKPDQKEGLYFGEELGPNHFMVKEKKPLHGQNLFPEHPVELREIVLEYTKALTKLGHQLMQLISLSLDLEAGYLQKNYTKNPFTLLRIFHYPASNKENTWGVGEHTDYGVLTILKQDAIGGLQVKSNHKWIDAPPIQNTFVCNIGDMLERMTAGLYRSTPHRVLNTSNKSRFSYPFFFDPNFDAKITPIQFNCKRPLSKESNSNVKRWDQKSVFDFKGTYGEYILEKVGKVFPDLADTQ